MRIRVKSEGYNINIPIHTGLIFSRAAVWAWLKIGRKTAKRYVSEYVPEDVNVKVGLSLDRFSDEAVYALCDELMRIKRKYGKWNLVEVESTDGDQVLIQL